MNVEKKAGWIGVIGGGGFLGTRLIEWSLLHDQAPWIPVIRSVRSLARLSRLGALAWKKADTGSVDALAAALEGCAVVVNVTLGDTHTMLAETRIIWEACQKAKVGRLIHLSSAVVYDRVTDPAITDDSPPVPNHWMYYARAKGDCETYLLSRRDGPEVIILRPGLIWGPGSPWSHLPARQLDRGSVWLAHGGQGVCNLIHIDNLVRCIRQCAQGGSGVTGGYNIGDPGVVTWQQFVKGVATQLGYPVDRVKTIPAGPLARHKGLYVEWLKQQDWFYAGSKWALKRMAGESKSRLKSILPWLAGGEFQAPVPVDAPCPEGHPRFTRELWSLQSTERKLPMDKFVRVFGDPKLDSFEVALTTTCQWLNFVGYGRRDA